MTGRNKVAVGHRWCHPAVVLWILVAAVIAVLAFDAGLWVGLSIARAEDQKLYEQEISKLEAKASELRRDTKNLQAEQDSFKKERGK